MKLNTLLSWCDHYYLFSMGEEDLPEETVVEENVTGVEGVDYLNFDGHKISREYLQKMEAKNPEQYVKITKMFFTDNQLLKDRMSNQIIDMDRLVRYCGNQDKYKELVEDAKAMKREIENSLLALEKSHLSADNLFQLYRGMTRVHNAGQELNRMMKEDYGLQFTRDGVKGINDMVGGKGGVYAIKPGNENNVIRLLSESGELDKMLVEIMGIYGMRPVGINLVVKDWGDFRARRVPEGKIEVVMKVGDSELNRAVSEEMSSKYFVTFCHLIMDHPNRLLVNNWNIKLR